MIDDDDDDDDDAYFLSAYKLQDWFLLYVLFCLFDFSCRRSVINYVKKCAS
jgi:hypothetical protein